MDRQAFPRPAVALDSGRIFDGKPGMTLAEYFAAHAPDEIPGWFNPPPVAIRDPRPDPSDFFGDNEQACRMALDWAVDGDYDLESAFTDHGIVLPAAAFTDAMKEWWRDGERVGQMNTQARYFAWRAFYGKQLAAEMAK